MSNDITVFRQQLASRKDEFLKVLPKQIPADRFLRTLETAVVMDSNLMAADRASLVASAMKAAQDGLLCDGREAALTIFNTKTKDGNWVKKVQYIPMVAGLLKKMRNSGEVSAIDAKVVYKNDRFRTWFDDGGEHVEFEANLDDDRGDFRLVFAYARLRDGGFVLEIMTKADIEKVRGASKSGNTGPWVNWFDEMARKSAIRRISKRLPSSSDLQGLLDHDNEDFEFAQPEATPEVFEKPIETQTIAEKMAIGMDTVMPQDD